MSEAVALLVIKVGIGLVAIIVVGALIGMLLDAGRSLGCS